METRIVNIADLKEIPEFRNFYAAQPIEDLLSSYKLDGQKVPIHITEDNYIIDGYRRVDAIKKAGGKTAYAIIMRIKPMIYDRIVLNQSRQKTTRDQIQEVKYVFKRFPKRQGQKNADGKEYVRDELISATLNNRFKGDKIIQRLEKIVENDLEGDVLLTGILEKYWKVDTCYEFLTAKLAIDEEKGYGFAKQLIAGKYSVAEVNKFIDERWMLDNKFDYSFVIPQRTTFYNENCVRLPDLLGYKKEVDLIITSIPYWNLKDYKVGGDRQLGHEETKEEYARSISSIFQTITPILKNTANVIINIGESYKNGVAQGIPFLIKDYIEKYTTLIYKDTLIWSKKNPKPQGENVKRPTNSIEYLLWFVVDPTIAKYNLLTFPVDGKRVRVSNGAKDVSSKGQQARKAKSIAKPYGKLLSHLKEQEIENIITTAIGKDAELYGISSVGHPAPMSATLPITLILMLSDENDMCCDPFGGSNVVGKCALELNRQYVGTELSKEYFDIGCQRLINANKNYDPVSLGILNELVHSNNPNSSTHLPNAA